MGDVRFFTDLRVGLAVLTGTAVVLSWGLADLLQRLGQETPTLVSLASQQARGMFLITVIGAGFGAFVAVRYRRRSARDLWVTGARAPEHLSNALLVATWWPMVAGWLLFVLVTGVRFGNMGGLFAATQVWVACAAATVAGCAVGVLVGAALHHMLALPIAVVTAYAGTIYVVEAGDDSWWQWLAPGYGDAVGDPTWLWTLGQICWYAGVGGALALIAAVLTSTPRRPSGTAIAVAVSSLITGCLLLLVNGPSAGG